MRLARIVLAVLALASLSACRTGTEDLPPCPSENSGVSCYWDARTRGDGNGASFVVDEFGRVTFTYDREI